MRQISKLKLWPHLCTMTILCLLAEQAVCAKPKPHYVYVLPTGYVGWVRIIHNDNEAQHRQARKDGSVWIEVSEDSEARYSDMTFHLDLVGGPDQFYYHDASGIEASSYIAVPSEFVMANDPCHHPSDKPSCYSSTHGGFTSMNLDEIPGSLIYFFIGPPGRRPAYYGVVPKRKCTWQPGETPPHVGRLNSGEVAQPNVCSLPSRVEH